MSPLVVISILAIAALGAVIPWSEKQIRVFSLFWVVGSAALAIVLAWPGLQTAVVFGEYELWYRDGVTTLMCWLIAVISVSAVAVSYRYLAKELRDGIIALADLRLYYALVPIFLGVMYVAVFTNHIGLMWLALEATTLVTTLLVAFYRKRSAIEAAWKYVLLCSLGMSLALVGIVLTAYAAQQPELTNSLLLSHYRELAIAGNLNAPLLRWAFVFVFIGIGTKVGFVPMHAWLADAHSRAPAPISALLSGLVLNVALVVLLRFKALLDLTLVDGGSWSGKFFLIFGAMSIMVPTIIMLAQKSYKRLLAYSSIAAMGIIAFAVGLGAAGLIPALIFMIGHAFVKSSLFLGTGEIFTAYKTTESGVVMNLSRRLPKTASLFLLTTLLLLPVPPSGLFAAQLILIGFGLRTNVWLTFAVGIALTLMFVAVLRHVYQLVFQRRHEDLDAPVSREAWQITHIVMGVHFVIVILFGLAVMTTPGLQVILTIAQSLNTELL